MPRASAFIHPNFTRNLRFWLFPQSVGVKRTTAKRSWSYLRRSSTWNGTVYMILKIFLNVTSLSTVFKRFRKSCARSQVQKDTSPWRMENLDCFYTISLRSSACSTTLLALQMKQTHHKLGVKIARRNIHEIY